MYTRAIAKEVARRRIVKGEMYNICHTQPRDDGIYERIFIDVAQDAVAPGVGSVFRPV